MDQASNLRDMLRKESERMMSKDGGVVNPSAPRVISVTSGKGGVGKTNLVANLAVELQRLKKKVLILDADLGLANIDIIFGLKTDRNIDAVIHGEVRLSEIIVEGPAGVSVIPASSGVHDLSNLTDGQKIHLLNEFDRLEADYDILLIDTGAGISPNVIYFNIAAQERLILVTPEPTSITDAYAVIKVLHQNHAVSNFYLAMNMVKGEAEAKRVFGHISKVVDRFLNGVSLDYAGYVPMDTRLKESVRMRKPVVFSFPQAPSARAITRMAKWVLEQRSGLMDGNIKFFFRQLVKKE